MREKLLVFSHHRWSSVYRRPQQVLSRLARRYCVFFVEEPIAGADRDALEVTEAANGVRVCRPYSALRQTGFHDDHIPAYRRWLAQLSAEHRLDGCVAWLYSPMALPLARLVSPRMVVYDCIEELSSFAKAPRQLRQRESALLKIADIVFTAGPSLYRAKRESHAAVYCFPSSVDREHFARARDPDHEHAEQRTLPRPRLGYFGTIDERIDMALVAALADSHPEWQIVMVGPVAIDAARLPRRPNIRYYGQRSYDELPSFLAGWDVCLLPFALSRRTRYACPTKTLEYMAAERPVVSTPITDVVEPYGDTVLISAAHDFVAACECALDLGAAQRAQQRAAMRAAVERTSWDATAAEMAAIVEAVLASKPADGARPPAMEHDLFRRKGAAAARRRAEAPPAPPPRER
jgi:UDP-galactopyranose mutase